MLVTFALLLSACSSKTAEAANTSLVNTASPDLPLISSESRTATGGKVPYPANAPGAGKEEMEISPAMELMLGTIKLEETESAVTKEQAGILLPLWKNYKALANSSFPGRGGAGQATTEAAPQVPTISPDLENQIDDLVEQIRSALTEAQLQAISDMEITRETSQSVMEELGISTGGFLQRNEGKPSGVQPQQGNGGISGDDQPPQGTPLTGGPGANMNGGGTPSAGGQQPGGPIPGLPGGGRPSGDNIPSELIDNLIDLLESSAG